MTKPQYLLENVTENWSYVGKTGTGVGENFTPLISSKRL